MLHSNQKLIPDLSEISFNINSPPSLFQIVGRWSDALGSASAEMPLPLSTLVEFCSRLSVACSRPSHQHLPPHQPLLLSDTCPQPLRFPVTFSTVHSQACCLCMRSVIDSCLSNFPLVGTMLNGTDSLSIFSVSFSPVLTVVKLLLSCMCSPPPLSAPSQIVSNIIFSVHVKQYCHLPTFICHSQRRPHRYYLFERTSTSKLTLSSKNLSACS